MSSVLGPSKEVLDVCISGSVFFPAECMAEWNGLGHGAGGCHEDARMMSRFSLLAIQTFPSAPALPVPIQMHRTYPSDLA